MLPTGQHLVEVLQKHKGESYHLGALIPKNEANYSGPWDCAEFVTWGIYQISGQLYGCSNNNGNPDSADAWTGFWNRDAQKLGKIIGINEAARIPGAALLRVAGNGVTGHIVVSRGDGTTIEAHSTKDGVVNNVVDGRRWDFGILVPWINYMTLDPVNVNGPTGTIYRLTIPYMTGSVIGFIQKALGIFVDNIYGPATMVAVKSYQAKHGLVADGEAGPKTLAMMGMNI